ncbi:HD domain-containing protein, partial [Streptomyces sp. NPDC002952]|uniref:HD domain-containing protein n=1 Tax=Streptomyces sp. NPDC002952 TaxID=3364673 RepID=UPI00367E8CC6
MGHDLRGSQLGNRWLHTQAVAARAQGATAAAAEADRDLLVAAAWLHDIGYVPELHKTAFHPLHGARHLESLDAPARPHHPHRPPDRPAEHQPVVLPHHRR